ncbi:hypothetical protein FRC03_011677 [Tulasnella sp. 419]|nr:hypothetical protein FRC03_011677 [Tulasnella sp. 419]
MLYTYILLNDNAVDSSDLQNPTTFNSSVDPEVLQYLQQAAVASNPASGEASSALNEPYIKALEPLSKKVVVMEQNNASCWTNLKDSINRLERDLAKVAVDVAGVNNRFDELNRFDSPDASSLAKQCRYVAISTSSNYM